MGLPDGRLETDKPTGSIRSSAYGDHLDSIVVALVEWS